MKNINWKSSEEIADESLRRKDLKYPYCENRPVTVSEKRLYIGQLEKGGVSIARYADDDEFRGSLRCRLWLNVPHRKNANGYVTERDSIIVHHVSYGEKTDCSIGYDPDTHFLKACGGSRNLWTFFKEKELYKLGDTGLFENLKSLLLKTYERMPAT